MKITRQQFSQKAVFLGMILATATLAMAQTTATITTSAGTVREFSPDTFTIAEDASASPVRYTYSKTTTYVDENGNPVSMETVRSGLPVTVFYARNGDQLMATKVVVRKSVDTSADGTTSQTTTTTSSTSSQGTVNTFSPDAMVITSDATPGPVNFTFSKTVSYVDENGNPVSIDTVKSGVPVTVFYRHDGDQMVATRVVVRSSEPNGTVIEHKKTTTTTTETTPNP